MVEKDIKGNVCVICGEPIPEGTWVCPNCEARIVGEENE